MREYWVSKGDAIEKFESFKRILKIQLKKILVTLKKYNKSTFPVSKEFNIYLLLITLT